MLSKSDNVEKVDVIKESIFDCIEIDLSTVPPNSNFNPKSYMDPGARDRISDFFSRASNINTRGGIRKNFLADSVHFLSSYFFQYRN